MNNDNLIVVFPFHSIKLNAQKSSYEHVNAIVDLLNQGCFTGIHPESYDSQSKFIVALLMTSNFFLLGLQLNKLLDC